nr:hypothetical protein [Streptomyces sp. CC228A]
MKVGVTTLGALREIDLTASGAPAPGRPGAEPPATARLAAGRPAEREHPAGWWPTDREHPAQQRPAAPEGPAAERPADGRSTHVDSPTDGRVTAVERPADGRPADVDSPTHGRVTAIERPADGRPTDGRSIRPERLAAWRFADWSSPDGRLIAAAAAHTTPAIDGGSEPRSPLFAYSGERHA